MSLTYACIAKDSIIVCDYGTAPLSVSQVAKRILEKIPTDPSIFEKIFKKSYKFDGNVYHYQTDMSDPACTFTVMVVAPESPNVGIGRVAFQCAIDLRDRFLSTQAERPAWRTATENS